MAKLLQHPKIHTIQLTANVDNVHKMLFNGGGPRSVCSSHTPKCIFDARELLIYVMEAWPTKISGLLRKQQNRQEIEKKSDIDEKSCRKYWLRYHIRDQGGKNNIKVALVLPNAGVWLECEVRSLALLSKSCVRDQLSHIRNPHTNILQTFTYYLKMLSNLWKPVLGRFHQISLYYPIFT